VLSCLYFLSFTIQDVNEHNAITLTKNLKCLSKQKFQKLFGIEKLCQQNKKYCVFAEQKRERQNVTCNFRQLEQKFPLKEEEEDEEMF
jgi:hypothetical protein